ncbi:MAG: DUF2851 family protein [Bacteroidales bacterium]
MNENFLQYLWKYGLFDSSSTVLDNGEKIEIISAGEHNTNAGPDFTNVKIKIGQVLWAGNVEIHVNSSDWEKHGHHHDKAYDNVIIQAVAHHDRPVKRTNGEPIPTITLKYNPKYYNNYADLINSRNWISCEHKINDVNSFIIRYWLEKLMIERLESKAGEITRYFKQNKNNWEETFYQRMGNNFGFKLNAQPFEMLVKSIPLNCLAKHKNNLLQIEALFFGQAGMLNDLEHEDDYIKALKREYAFLQKKFNLKPVEKHLWKFLRLRPSNFPTIRIAQFASLIYSSSKLFSKILEANDVEEIKKLLSVTASSYWDVHYTFGKASAKRVKTLGDAGINILLINTIIPFLFVYGKVKDSQNFKDQALKFLENIKAEQNHIIKGWKKLGIIPENALQSQALLQLKNVYCNQKRCLDCQIGNQVISKH